MIIPLTLLTLTTLTACGEKETTAAEVATVDTSELEARLTSLESSRDAADAEAAALRSDLTIAQSQIIALRDELLALNGAVDLTELAHGVATNAAAIADLENTNYATETWVTTQGYVADPMVDDLLRYIRVDTDTDSVVLAGANLYIQSGEGRTDVTNGTGNLIIGYDSDDGTDDKSGSHNLVVGDDHTYSSYGGIVVGLDNTITGEWASVTGGRTNSAEGDYSLVAGGSDNIADGWYAVVAGGQDGLANGTYTAITGGRANSATGPYAAVSGGDANLASGTYATASGGSGATASSAWSHVP